MEEALNSGWIGIC